MSVADLHAEMDAAALALPFSAVRMVIALGAQQRFVARLTGAAQLGLARVELSRDGASFSPDGPDSRLILPVFDADGELIDLVALASHARDEWALRVGDGWALGLDALADVEQARDRAIGLAPPHKAPRSVSLRIHATPLDWLASGGEGLCVLDWGPMALTSLRALGERVTLVVDTGAQERLRGLLAIGGLPRVEQLRVSGRLAA